MVFFLLSRKEPKKDNKKCIKEINIEKIFVEFDGNKTLTWNEIDNSHLYEVIIGEDYFPVNSGKYIISDDIINKINGKNILIKIIAYSGTGSLDHLGEGEKYIKVRSKDCNISNFGLIKNGKSNTITLGNDGKNGIFYHNYLATCKDGNLIYTNPHYISAECNNGYIEKDKRCVEKENYEVKLFLSKEMGLDNNEAMIEFIVDVHLEGIDKVEIIKFETEGDSTIKNDDYDDITSYPEEIKNGDEWYIIASSEGNKEVYSYTYKITFENLGDQEYRAPIEIIKKVYLNLGKYLKDY
ncbi:MAG: hypothetical protein Q9M94_05435 [Candidatus Gracilibacteria bacterium]|nr:hypothetical protein [Candidatus Gracilibacteria bacterium]